MPRADLIKSDPEDHPAVMFDNLSENGRIIWCSILIIIDPLSQNICYQLQIPGCNPVQCEHLDPKYGYFFVY